MTRAVVTLVAFLALAPAANARTCPGSLDHPCPWDSVTEVGTGTLNAPRAAWPSADGGVFVADMGNARLARFDAAGALMGTSPASADAGALAPGGDSVLLSAGSVERRTPDGGVSASWPAPDGGTSYSPSRGVAVGGDGTIYVTNAGTQNGGAVVRYSRDGAELGRFSDHVDRPASVAVAPNGEVYVISAAVSSHTVDVYSPDGAWQRSLGDFCGYPESVAVDGQGTIYVGSYGRVAVLSPDGQVLGAFGEVGGGPAQFGDPRLAVAPGDQLLVTDRDSNRVLRFHIDRSALAPLGVAACQLFQPHPPIPTTSPGEQFLPRSVRVARGRALIPIRCPARHRGRCRGTVTIGLADRHARGRFDVARGRKVTVRIRLRGRAWHLALIQHRFVTLDLRMNDFGATTWVLLHH